MLGHSSIMLTLGTYSHVVQPIRREAAERMKALFQPAPKTQVSTSSQGTESPEGLQ
jgi:hypothetical protein